MHLCPNRTDICPGKISVCTHCQKPEDCLSCGEHILRFLSRSRGENIVKKFDLSKQMKEGEKSTKSSRMTEKGRLFDLLIHDLSGPLSVVSTSTENLLKKSDRYGPLTDSQKRTLDRILRNIPEPRCFSMRWWRFFAPRKACFSDQFQIERAVRESLMDALETTVPHARRTLVRQESRRVSKNPECQWNLC